MIMASVINAVTGIEIQNPTPIRGLQFAANATLIADVHLQNIEQSDPLWIDEGFVQFDRIVLKLLMMKNLAFSFLPWALRRLDFAIFED
jgi:hypothetical protein